MNCIDRLSDSEKFVIILQKYSIKEQTQQELAEEIGIPKQAVSDWKKNTRNIQVKNRNRISKYFKLNDMIWIDSFEDTVNFEESLDSYLLKKKKADKVKKNKLSLLTQTILSPKIEITNEEKIILTELSTKKEILLSDEMINKMTSASLFELTKIYKKKNFIKESLALIKKIKRNESFFKYKHSNEIEHLKAILLSHKSIQKWTEAIDILRLLYVNNYYLEEPEILTLLASNYKRKALYSSKDKKEEYLKIEEIDIDLLSSALILYREAYEVKEGTFSSYYDAINFAYIYNITDSIELEQSNNLELKILYEKLKKEWTPNLSDWWEVSSDAEFLMLMGNIELAKHNITTFLEEQSINTFHIETTLRQLELYLNFTQDNNAKEFYDYLYESWQHIKK